ncbi:MAG: fibronectin type III domain-containing protein, partial [Candidatus Hydrogenedentes bacterium]|nr:fibronectin type III domain-containing protein [Candidatus Hydrogenedentota bacterium]
MKRVVTGMLLFVFAGGIALAHVGNHPSVHDTVAGIVMRMQRNLPAEELTGITVPEVLDFLSEEERDVLATQHLIFNVNVPVVLHLYRQKAQEEVVYWLKDRDFEKTPLEVSVDGERFEVWRKEFDAGEIGLGVNSLSGNGDHYFISLAPQDAGDTVEITNIYPGLHTLGTMQLDERAYISWDDRTLTALPAELEGEVLLRGDPNKRRTARLIDVYRITPYPATARPDHVVLTWSDDPKTTQAIQWRTSTETNEGAVRYRLKGSGEEWTTVAADSEMLVNYNTVNDPLCLRHTVNLTGLSPDSAYEYCVGDDTENGWLKAETFETAPSGVAPFKFIYMGDAQNGLDAWGTLVHKAYDEEPDAAFYIMAGDLVNR